MGVNVQQMDREWYFLTQFFAELSRIMSKVNI